MKTKYFLINILTALLVAGPVWGQQQRQAVEQSITPYGPACSQPIKIVLHGQNPVVQYAPDLGSGSGYVGSAFNQTAINKEFAYTFFLPDCCRWTKAYLTVTVKALQSGPPNSPTSANDWVTINHMGQAVPQFSWQPFANGAILGQIATHTFALNQNDLALLGNHITFAVEDDTAVMSADLTLEGCCHK